MNGVEVLITRSTNNPINIDAIEKEFGIEIPPIFRILTENFEWNPKLIEEPEKVFHFIPDFSIGDFSIPYGDLRGAITSSINNDDEIDEKKWILVANSTYGTFLGTKGEEKDKIIVRTSSLEGKYKVIANNIFEFIRGLTSNIYTCFETADDFKQYLIESGELEDQINFLLKLYPSRKKQQDL